MSEDKKRATMADIISAKCFGCGHVVKVPVALAGKKAKCPQCAQVIVIPSHPDPAGEFISDDQLPEVARDEDVLQGLPVEEDEIIEGEPVEEKSASGSRLRSMTPRRGTPQAARGGRQKGTGVHSRVPAHGGHAPPPKSSAAPVIIGVIVAAAALVVVLVLAFGKGPGGKKPQEQEKQAQPPPPAVSEADIALQRRCLEFVSVFNRGNVIEIMKFYSCGPGEEQKVKASISALLEQGTRYDDVGFKSTSAANGTVTFSHSKGERTITWKSADGVWLIAGQ